MAANTDASRGAFWANTQTVVSRVGELRLLTHDKFIGDSLIRYGEWAQREIDVLLGYLSPGDFAIDVGANLGFHALSFARRVGRGGEVWAFEPDPINGLLLRLNIINTGTEGVVVPFDLALGADHGLCHFRSYPISVPENFGHAAVDEDNGDYPRVMTRLDLLSIPRPPSLVKIDVEGHEMPALEGMLGLIEAHRPVLSVEADAEADADRIARHLSELGYDCFDFITDAFNPDNFAGNPEDVWGGHGRCANLLALAPGKHKPPTGLTLRRPAVVQRRTIARLGDRAGSAYVSEQIRPEAESMLAGSSALRAEVREFVSELVRTTFGRIDRERHGALINAALAYLAADGVAAESDTLRSLLVVAANTLVGSLAREQDVEAASSAAEAQRDAFSRLDEELRRRMAELAASSREQEELREELETLGGELAAVRASAEDFRAAADNERLALNARLSAAERDNAELLARCEQQAEAFALAQARAEKRLAAQAQELRRLRAML